MQPSWRNTSCIPPAQYRAVRIAACDEIAEGERKPCKLMACQLAYSIMTEHGMLCEIGVCIVVTGCAGRLGKGRY